MPWRSEVIFGSPSNMWVPGYQVGSCHPYLVSHLRGSRTGVSTCQTGRIWTPPPQEGRSTIKVPCHFPLSSSPPTSILGGNHYPGYCIIFSWPFPAGSSGGFCLLGRAFILQLRVTVSAILCLSFPEGWNYRDEPSHRASFYSSILAFSCNDFV